MAHSPNDIVNSVLFKRNAPRIHSISHSRLVFELALASTTAHVKLEVVNISSAMVWRTTPQGEEFWRRLHKEAHVNAYEL